ncbi:hypothetical protein ACJBSG_10840, partial [Streptococcus suis]
RVSWKDRCFLHFLFTACYIVVLCSTSGNPRQLKSFSNVLENFSLYHCLNIKQSQKGLVFLFPKWSRYDIMEGVKI